MNFSRVRGHLAVSLILLMASACSQGVESSPERSTATATVAVRSQNSQPPSTPGVSVATPMPGTSEPGLLPTATTTQIAKSTPTATPTPTLDLPAMSLDAVNIRSCRISGDLGNSGAPRHGTAAAPTPTPVPTDGSRDLDVVREEMTEYRLELHPIAVVLSDLDDVFQDAWPHAGTIEMQASQLHVFGNRLAQLCSAASQPTVPPEAIGAAVGLGEAIRAMHAWTLFAVDELVCCGDSHTSFVDAGLTANSAAIERAHSSLDELFDGYQSTGNDDSPRVVTNERLGLSMTIAPEAILVRNTIDILVTFVEPSEFLDPASLGPQNWTDGTAIRIRRLRNRSELTVDQAIHEYEGFLTQYGDVTRSNVLNIPQLGEIQLMYSQLDDSWYGSVMVFVSGGFTYLVESMCSPFDPIICDSIDDSVESIRLSQ